MIKIYKCLTCKHFVFDDSMIPKCQAFPSRIPVEIFREEVDHTKPYPGDNGIQFEPKDDINER